VSLPGIMSSPGGYEEFVGLYLHSDLPRFRGGLVFKAHRRLHHSTLGLREIKKKRRSAAPPGSSFICFFIFPVSAIRSPGLYVGNDRPFRTGFAESERFLQKGGIQHRERTKHPGLEKSSGASYCIRLQDIHQ